MLLGFRLFEVRLFEVKLFEFQLLEITQRWQRSAEDVLAARRRGRGRGRRNFWQADLCRVRCAANPNTDIEGHIDTAMVTLNTSDIEHFSTSFRLHHDRDRPRVHNVGTFTRSAHLTCGLAAIKSSEFGS